ncbi:MAG: histidine kinase [candidate division KSB1 bacterium]
MHPILAHKTKLGLYLASWLMLAVLLAALAAAVGGNLSWQEALALLVPMMLVYAFVCLSTWYLCRVFTLERSSVLQLFGVYAVAAIVSTALWLALGKTWVEVLAKLPWFAGINTRYPHNMALLAGAAFLLFWLTAVLHYLLISFEQTRSVEKRLLQLDLLAREAELQNLKAQIHPHFLFNSLHAISALTAIDAGAAREMCLRLSEFLRQSLALKAETRIPLKEELRLLDHYLALEQVRFGSRLRVEKNIAADAEDGLVPALLLQPLVENAVNHGLAHLVEGGTISLQARRLGEGLEITIMNPCDVDHIPRKGEGVGLRNVTKRLAALYGGQAQLACENGGEFFRAKIVLPCEWAKAISAEAA